MALNIESTARHVPLEETSVDPQAASTANSLLGHPAIRPLGVVRGITVRSRNIAAQIGAGFKTLVGGEIATMTTLCETARQEALTRMLQEASQRGATGVVAARYSANSIAPGITEVTAYGLAVSRGSTSQREDVVQVCTTNDLPGGQPVCLSLGVVQGITVRSRNAVASIGAGFKSMVGGEISTFTKLCDDARGQAYLRMVEEATALGADAVLAMRYETNEVSEGVTEVLAYGTAVSSRADAGGASSGRADEGGALSRMVTTSNVLPALARQFTLGVVRGISVMSTNVFKAVGAGLKTLVGGEVHTYSRLAQKVRKEAFDRMLAQAQGMGAKGVVAMRYDSNEVAPGIVEVLAYGAAVSDQPRASVPNQLLLCSTDVEVAGLAAANQPLGVVRGISVQAVNLVRSVGAGFKTLVGGEIWNYTHMCELAREEALVRMLRHAESLGAAGVAAMRFESNDLSPGVIEVVAYGTAVGATPSTGAALPVTTASELPGYCERSLGIVRGITVRSRNVAANIGAGLKATFVGGEVATWTTLCESARCEALERMLRQAAELGARGIVAMRYETNEVAAGVTEVLAYGTAVA